MPGALGDPRQADDDVVYVTMGSTDNTATRGDYIGFSGRVARAISTGNTVALYPLSGLGIALGQNPVFDSQGSASANGRLPVARFGIFRVSGVTGAQYSAGTLVFPISTGSGIVGQTGLTGQAAVWSATATLPGLVSANSSVAFYATAVGSASGIITAFNFSLDRTSAVAQITRVISAGGTGQWDIVLLPPFAANAPLVSR